MTEFDDRIRALEAELADLKASVAEHEEIKVTSSGRDLIRKVAIGAGVAAASTVAIARPAAAADNDALLMGVEGGQNTATLGTRGDYTGTTPRAAFLFQAGDNYASDSAIFPSALAGWATAFGTLPNGVYGFSEITNGAGVVGFGRGATTIGGLFLGDRAQLSLSPNEAAPSGAHFVGDLYQTKPAGGTGGTLWACVTDGTPGVFRKLAGPETAGSLHLLPAPVRVYDSRPALAPIVGGDGPLGGGVRTIDLTSGFVVGTATSAVPHGATGAMISVTLDATTAQGFLAVFSNAVTDVSSSNLNWYTAGQMLAVTTVSAVDAAAKIKVKAGGGGTTQLIVDVIGYYL